MSFSPFPGLPRIRKLCWEAPRQVELQVRKANHNLWERQQQGLEGVVAGESEICYIDGYPGVLSYRGYNIHTLAEHATFEEVIFLLWNGWLPKQAELDQLKKDLVAERDLPGRVIDFLKGVPKANAMDVLRTAVSMLSLYDPKRRTCRPRPTIAKPCG